MAVFVTLGVGLYSHTDKELKRLAGVLKPLMLPEDAACRTRRRAIVFSGLTPKAQLGALGDARGDCWGDEAVQASARWRGASVEAAKALAFGCKIVRVK